MAQNSANYHEPIEWLSPEPIERHRALVSLMEELEAIDWYQQRIDASGDEQLKRILAHNRDEEIEHASMALEWLRRRDAVLDAQLREHLFRDGEIVTEHEPPPEATEPPACGDGSLGIGSLRSIRKQGSPQ